MSKIKCIIIEDEPLAVKVLSDYIRRYRSWNYREHLKMLFLQLTTCGIIQSILFF